MMARAETGPFKGAWTLWVCWSVTVGLFLWVRACQWLCQLHQAGGSLIAAALWILLTITANTTALENTTKQHETATTSSPDKVVSTAEALVQLPLPPCLII